MAQTRLAARVSVAGRVGAAVMGLLTPDWVAATNLAPLSGPPGAQPPAPWAFVGLPGQTLPVTRFVLERLDTGLALRVQAAASYGNLVHALKGVPAGWLSWRWRVDQALASADLRTREGDDVALMLGLDRDASAGRTFRLDGIDRLQVLDEGFVQKSHRQLAPDLEDLFRSL